MKFIAKSQFLGCFTSTLIAFDYVMTCVGGFHYIEFWGKGAKNPATAVPERDHQATMLRCGHFKLE